MQSIRACALLACLVGFCAAGQPLSPAELRRQNDELRAALEGARAEIERLTGEVTTLRNERRGLEGRLSQAEGIIARMRAEIGRIDIPEPAPLRAPAPTDPLASPESLLRELRSRYRVATLGQRTETENELASYAEAVRLWARVLPRELRGKRDWLVTFNDLETHDSGDGVARLTVIDATSGLPVGEGIDVAVPKRFADRLAGGRGGGRDGSRWVLSAIVIARPMFNAERHEPGVFEHPPFVGRFAEFGFELDWVALKAWEPERSGSNGNDPADDPSEPQETPAEENEDA